VLQTLTKKTYTFEEYLEYHDNTDLKYELVNGELIPMPTPSGLHADIMVFLFKQFDKEIERLGLDWKVRPGNIGVRTSFNKSRIPDLVIITESQRQELREMTSAVVQYYSPEQPEIFVKNYPIFPAAKICSTVKVNSGKI